MLSIILNYYFVNILCKIGLCFPYVHNQIESGDFSKCGGETEFLYFWTSHTFYWLHHLPYFEFLLHSTWPAPSESLQLGMLWLSELRSAVIPTIYNSQVRAKSFYCREPFDSFSVAETLAYGDLEFMVTCNNKVNCQPMSSHRVRSLKGTHKIFGSGFMVRVPSSSCPGYPTRWYLRYSVAWWCLPCNLPLCLPHVSHTLWFLLFALFFSPRIFSYFYWTLRATAASNVYFSFR